MRGLWSEGVGESGVIHLVKGYINMIKSVGVSFSENYIANHMVNHYFNFRDVLR